MPTFLRIMEIISCSMAGFLPYILLLVVLFRLVWRKRRRRPDEA